MCQSKKRFVSHVLSGPHQLSAQALHSQYLTRGKSVVLGFSQTTCPDMGDRSVLKAVGIVVYDPHFWRIPVLQNKRHIEHGRNATS